MIRAYDIVRLLREKHSQDVFVEECKTGATQSAAHLRMDGWAMAKSWANPLTVGYEIKVSRSDFLKDEKWRGYLKYCNQFYFVCPKGIIKPSEITPEVGLLYVASTGTRLTTQKKAPYREVAIPEDLFRYILMCRAQVSRQDLSESKADRWRAWLNQKQENRELGYDVSRAIRDKATALEVENMRLKQEIKRYDEVREEIKRVGLDEGCRAYHVRYKAEQLKQIVPQHLKQSLHSLKSACDNFEASLKTLEAA